MKRRILNTEIEFADYKTLKSLIFQKVSAREKFIVTYANSYVCSSALKNPELHGCLDKFDLVHPDGVAVHAAHKFLYKPGRGAVRVNGTDLYLELFVYDAGFKCFILGGPEDSSALIEEKFGDKIKVCGYIHELNDSSSPADEINKSGADILFVALGTPVQEKWIIQNRDTMNVPVIIAAGSGIDFLTGKKRRAPVFMRKAGIEWLFRLFSEPARLWKRYLVTNPVFIFKVIGQKLKLNIKQGNT